MYFLNRLIDFLYILPVFLASKLNKHIDRPCRVGIHKFTMKDVVNYEFQFYYK